MHLGKSAAFGNDQSIVDSFKHYIHAMQRNIEQCCHLLCQSTRATCIGVEKSFIILNFICVWICQLDYAHTHA